MTGGGKDLKNQSKLICYLCKIFSFVKFCIKKISAEKTSIPSDRRIKKILDATSRCRGAILIEFAVCMPILIILLFYIHDLVRIKRYYSQTEFVAQQMVNIIQNLAKQRAAEGETISLPDIKWAASLAYLSVYPGTTLYCVANNRHTLFHGPRTYVYYVKGLAEGKASCVWGLWINTATPRRQRWNDGTLSKNSGRSTIEWGTNVDPSSIYPTLKVEEGKSKIIIETQITWDLDGKGPNGESANSAREVFGLRLVNPRLHAIAAYFPSVVIFTPNNGFSETRPK